MRLLILSPHFPPSNAADHQRVRMYLPYLLELGWTITVLAVDSRDVAAPLDPILADAVPAQVEVIRVRAPSSLIGRLLRRRSLGWRALPGLRKAGDALLASRGFDLLYVSTTQFTIARLALRWQTQHGLPYVFDLQDPWISEHHRQQRSEAPPGGRLRYALAQRSARHWEPRVLGAAAAITVVSPQYVAPLLARDPQRNPDRILTLPFGVDTADFERMRRSGVEQSFFDPADGREHWVYVGRGGADLAPALAALFAALAQWQRDQPDAAAKVRLHFIGTSYASGADAQSTIAPIAQAASVATLVAEHPARVPYLQALRCMADASALLLPASTDRTYQPSKLHLAVLAGKPLLVLARTDGPLWSQLATLTGACVLAADNDQSDPSALATRIRQSWLDDPDARRRVPQADHWLQPHTARAAAGRLHALFQSLCGPGDH